MLSLEIERQKVSAGSTVFVQRSMRANSPSILGRYRWMLYILPSTVRGGIFSRPHFPPSGTRTGTRSSAPERMKTSDSLASWYLGNPLSVLRVIEGSEKVQPN